MSYVITPGTSISTPVAVADGGTGVNAPPPTLGNILAPADPIPDPPHADPPLNYDAIVQILQALRQVGVILA